MIGLNNGSLRVRCQSIISTRADLLLFVYQGRILIKIQKASLKEMHFNRSDIYGHFVKMMC